MRKTILAMVFFAVAVAAMATVYEVGEVPNVHVANRNDYVTNPDGILSEATVAGLNDTIGELWRTTSAEMVVVALDDVSGYEPDEFATKLFELWKIGKSDKDNGVLMLVVMEQRKVVIRTGRGVEGVLPDVVCGRIIRDVVIPAFRNGEYDEGVLGAVGMMCRILENPENADEIMSAIPNDSGVEDAPLSSGEVLTALAWLGFFAMLFLIVLLVVQVRGGKGLPLPERYDKVAQLLPYALFASFLGVGIPVLALIPIVLVMRRMRGKHDKCLNCGCKMHKLDEQKDNAYLSAGQDMEERLKSVDYDVWLCDNCGSTDVIPFVNRRSSYRQCPECGSRASALVSDRVVVPPTVGRAGQGMRVYSCRNCHKTHNEMYVIPKIVVAPIVIGGGGNRGGGGFSGGSFGGGMTMGGGASGGW